MPVVTRFGIDRERRRRDRDDAVVAHRDRLVQVMAFEPKAPGAGFRRRAEHREREPLRRALARHVALRRQHVLQRHHVAGLFDAGRRQQHREHVPGGRLLRRAHLLEPQPGLDVVARAEIVPVAPLRRVPRAKLAALRLSSSRPARNFCGVAARRSAAEPRPGLRRAGAGQHRGTGERHAAGDDAAAIGHRGRLMSTTSAQIDSVSSHGFGCGGFRNHGGRPPRAAPSARRYCSCRPCPA